MNKYAQMADRLYDQEQQMKRLEEENEELKEVHESDKRSLRLIAEKGADLEREISVLLSCKNCPDNKGGYICQKEYEDKCLAQKIQYIKELQEEIAELKKEQKEKIKTACIKSIRHFAKVLKDYDRTQGARTDYFEHTVDKVLKEEIKKWKDEWQEQVQKENNESYARTLQTIQLNKAKELLKDITSSYGSTEVSETQLYLKIKKAELFLKE